MRNLSDTREMSFGGSLFRPDLMFDANPFETERNLASSDVEISLSMLEVYQKVMSCQLPFGMREKGLPHGIKSPMKKISKAREIRRLNLSYLCEKKGTQAFIAEKMECNPSYVSNLINGNKPITENTARKIEAAMSKDELWLDTPHWNEGSASTDDDYEQKADKNVSFLMNLEDSDLVKSIMSRNSAVQLPVLKKGKTKNWVESINNVINHDGMIILSSEEVPVTKNTFGFIVSDDSMSDTLSIGDRLAIDPESKPESGDMVLVEISGDEVIRKLVNTAGDWLLIPNNQKYPTKNLDNNKIIGVVVAAVERPRVFIRK